jgi:hypothetical protein
VGIRMQLIQGAGRRDDRQRSERLAFLAAFLDDDAEPEVTADPEKWKGPRAGFHLHDVGVRDLAAMTIASMLGMGAKSYHSWRRADWTELIDDVKRALAEGAPDAGTVP